MIAPISCYFSTFHQFSSVFRAFPHHDTSIKFLRRTALRNVRQRLGELRSFGEMAVSGDGRMGLLGGFICIVSDIFMMDI